MYDRLYQRLDTKEGEDIYRMVKSREMKTRGIKDEKVTPN
jgi:hypothetical protein